MDTWILVIVALVATVVLVLVVDMVIKCRAKRKLRRARKDNQVHISAAIAAGRGDDQPQAAAQSYGGVSLIKPDADVRVVPREVAPVHAVSAPVDPKQYGYPVRYEDIARTEYAKQYPYNPGYYQPGPYQQNI